MRRTWMLGMLVGLLVSAPALGYAMEQAGAKYTLSLTKAYTPSEWTAEEGYLAQAGQKFVFGSKNGLLGWLELYNEPREAARQDTGLLRGMGKGLVNMFGDTVGGALHITTFPITMVDVALPEGGTDLL